MTRPMRRTDRALPDADALALLERGEFGVLSTVSADGQPYGVPVSYAVLDGAIVFHCAREGHKLDNLTANPRVSFCVVGATEVLPDQFATRYESVIAFGAAHELIGDAQHAALSAILRKYSADFLEKGEQYIESDMRKTRVFRVDVDSLSGKARP